MDARIVNKRLLAALIALEMAFSGCTDDSLPTVKGPEALDLVRRLTGTLVLQSKSKTDNTKSTDNTQNELTVLSLPSLAETPLRPFGNVSPQSRNWIHAVSGPDHDGRLVYVHGMTRSHRLRVTRTDGGIDETVFERSNGPFDHIPLKNLSLAPKGGLVAFVHEGDKAQMRDPSARLELGTLEVWDIVKRKPLTNVAVTALIGWFSPFLSWFPDGRRLAYVELRPKEGSAMPSAAVDGAKSEYPSWAMVPVVLIMDTETATADFLSLGWNPVVASDGKSVLVTTDLALNAKWRRIDVADRRALDVTWPGADGPPIAVLESNLVLYWGLPTQGAKPAYSPYGSFRAGLQMISIKVAEINSDRFQTVVYPIDPRDHVSFGRVSGGM